MIRFVILCSTALCLLSAQPATVIVAEVGTYRISEDDLLTSFEFGPAFVKRHSDPLREHLRYMIYERLFALEATQSGLNTTEFVQGRIDALEEDGAVEQLYRQDILSKVSLPDEQIAVDTRKAKITIAIRWIYFDSQHDAEKTEQLINAGVSFDSLFMLQLDSTVGVDNRSLETTLLKLERDNASLARIISALSVNAISAPVAEKDGWYIFSLDKAEQQPIITESEMTQLKNQAIEIRTKLIADQLSDTYVKTMMTASNPVINAGGFNILRAYLADKGLSRDTKVRWEIPSTFMTEAGPQPIRNAGNYLHRPLVTYSGRTITIRDYAKWYDIRQFQFNTRSLEAFNASVKKTIWKMVQDRLLSERAYQQGLDRHPVVAHETKKWEAKLLYLVQRAALLRTISAADSNLKAYYEKHKNHYTNVQGKQMDFTTVRETVKSDYLAQEETRVLLKAVEEFKKKYRVTVHEDVLERCSHSMQSDSRAIDAVFYKPGGTFPRVAFPTIDEAWVKVR